MAWSKQDNLIPTTIGTIQHFLDDKDGTVPNMSMKFRLDIIDQQGDVITPRVAWSGSEIPHLTATQQTQIISFLNARRATFPTDLGVAGVQRIVHFLTDLDGTPGNQSIQYRVIDNLGNVHTGDESAFLTGPQQVQISQFLNDQRTKAEVIITG